MEVKIESVIEFLKGMQLEKVCVLGESGARSDVARIQAVIDDIESFYSEELAGD
ncbi:hypothetical protein [Cohnella massiliensis]|uniref:hypothetical protein n=1 Tax=Paenibacillaceae TaxID=186822 RepID=UPI0015941F53|nr:hypothetical protein [Cohnella massiliensis]